MQNRSSQKEKRGNDFFFLLLLLIFPPFLGKSEPSISRSEYLYTFSFHVIRWLLLGSEGLVTNENPDDDSHWRMADLNFFFVTSSICSHLRFHPLYLIPHTNSHQNIYYMITNNHNNPLPPRSASLTHT
ncbi:hypothetical protein CDAR_187301 [Caerostris darwini]|uniref:Uncharacterized protein n=1 Tax=Caerostris darwini TaxID=1538125 RepID=A0AAV4STV7_9ARAC|nr:hypothetical protein CDAR_187301 [Caerostris darwini]